jgi:hypothetical protein
MEISNEEAVEMSSIVEHLPHGNGDTSVEVDAE